MTSLAVLVLLASCVATLVVVVVGGYELERFDVEFGCDRVIGSGLVVDKCGVCGGDNSTCEFREGRFRQQFLTNGYHRVVEVPAGSTHISVTELTKSPSYLALKKSQEREDDGGEFLINGRVAEGAPDPSHVYRVCGTTFRYTRPFGESSRGEQLTSDGPTDASVVVMIFYQGSNPGISFSFVSPLSANNVAVDGEPDIARPRPATRLRQQRPGFPPSFPFSRARPASPLFRPPVEYVAPLDANTGANLAFEGRPLVVARRPPVDADKRRNVVNRIHLRSELTGKVAWKRMGFGQCSKTCATGVRVMAYRCVVNGSSQIVSERHCGDTRPKPRIQICNRKACPPFYDVGAWSECTRTCGLGRRVRRVACRQRYSHNFTAVVSHRKCKGLPRPPAHQRCLVAECARWKPVGDWSQCSRLCGTGVHTRRVECVDGRNQVVHERECSATTRPAPLRRTCNAGPCLTRWFVTDWQQCSADCSRGVQTRHVTCVNTASRADGCELEPRPNNTRGCARTACEDPPHEWFAGQWGPCSSECGGGFQDRKVVCVTSHADGRMTSSDACPPQEAPPAQRICNAHDCASNWHFTPWSQCTVSCGGGERSRLVRCLAHDGSFSADCSALVRPRAVERCNTAGCGHAVAEDKCVDRLSHCRLVLRTSARLCKYPYYRAHCCASCSGSVRARGG